MKSCRRTGNGFTLLELTIVLLVSTMVMLLAGALQSSYGHRSADLLERAEVVRELQLAIDSLRGDCGAATVVIRQQADSVVIRREPAALAAAGLQLTGLDAGVRYRLAGEDLIRRDLEFGGEYVVAQRLENFLVQRQGTEVRMILTAGTGAEQKVVTLRWRP